MYVCVLQKYTQSGAAAFTTCSASESLQIPSKYLRAASNQRCREKKRIIMHSARLVLQSPRLPITLYARTGSLFLIILFHSLLPRMGCRLRAACKMFKLHLSKALQIAAIYRNTHPRHTYIHVCTYFAPLKE